MKHIILICHKAHLVSGSVNFIKNLFERSFTVNIVTGDLSLSHVKALIKQKSDAIFVLWQMEFIAPWLTSLGRKVIVFPMYDGCGNAPKSYFKILEHAYLFNFSKNLHERCVDAGVVSYQLNYYPEKSVITEPTIKTDKLFFWLRRPDSSLSFSNITALFSPYIQGVHIHDRPDDYDLNTFSSQMADGFISTSNWFKNKEDLISIIAESKYYLAPRESEGIGMAFLEAMREGCIVFANRKSTHDQYIYNGYNGFLIDFDSENKEVIRQQLKEAFDIIHSGRPIGENARQFMEKGISIWHHQSEKIHNMLLSIDQSASIAPLRKSEQRLGFLLARSYYIHPWLYFVLSDIVIRFGYFTDKSIKFTLVSIMFTVIIKTLNVFKKIITRFYKR